MTEELSKGFTGIEVNGVKFSNIKEMLIYMNVQRDCIIELNKQIDKMKCCQNCKYNSYWGDELHCNYGLKEALQEDKLVECKNMDKWEIKEND